MAFTNTWDTAFGDDPGDTESRKYGAQQIRKLKDAIVERLQVDHEFGEELIGSGVDDQTDSGYHKRVTLLKGSVTEPASGYTELAAEGTKLKYFPEGDSEREVVDTDQAQTLTNKTLTSPTVSGGTINAPAINSPTISSPTIAGTVAIDTSNIKGCIPCGLGWINANGTASRYYGTIQSMSYSSGIYEITFPSVPGEQLVILATINENYYNYIVSVYYSRSGSVTKAYIYVRDTSRLLVNADLNVVMFILP